MVNDYVHNHVLRDVLTETLGSPLVITDGDKYSMTYSTTLDESWNADNMNVVAFIIGFYNPPRIVIGGGISRQGQKLIDYLMREEAVLPVPYRNKTLVSTARNSSGVIGAAKYALKKYGAGRG